MQTLKKEVVTMAIQSVRRALFGGSEAEENQKLGLSIEEFYQAFKEHEKSCVENNEGPFTFSRTNPVGRIQRAFAYSIIIEHLLMANMVDKAFRVYFQSTERKVWNVSFEDSAYSEFFKEKERISKFYQKVKDLFFHSEVERTS